MNEARMIGNECLDEAAKILGIGREEAEASFGAWMAEIFPEMWDDAGQKADGLIDDDYNHYADQFVSASAPRGGGGGGGSGEEWVGMVVGFTKRLDLMTRKREMAIDVATADIGTAIKNGFTYNGKHTGIGRAHTQNDVWRVEHSDGLYVSNEAADTSPNWVIPINEKLSIAMLKPDKTPQMAYSLKSMWIFHGNLKDKLLDEGPMTILLEGAWDAAEMNWKMFTPITLKGKFDPDGWNDSGPTLTVGNTNVTYGLVWVSDNHKEAVEKFFDPTQYLTTMAMCPLSDLLSHHFDGRKESYTDRNGNQRYDGPITCVVGNVQNINHEGREKQWDPTGRDYWLSISNQSLRRENPNAAIGIGVSGPLHDDHNGMNVLLRGEWLPFTNGSRIYVVGRTDSYTNQEGDDIVKIEAQGIYAVPKKSIPAKRPSEESNDLGNLSGFGMDGDN